MTPNETHKSAVIIRVTETQVQFQCPMCAAKPLRGLVPFKRAVQDKRVSIITCKLCSRKRTKKSGLQIEVPRLGWAVALGTMTHVLEGSE